MTNTDSGNETERGSSAEHLVTIQTFREAQAAMFAKSLLDSAGIDCILADDNTGHMLGFISDVLGGMRLQVNEADAEAAIALLRPPEPSNPTNGNDATSACCPMCGCADVTVQEIELPISSPGRLLTNVPATVREKIGKCSSCGYEWDQD